MDLSNGIRVAQTDATGVYAAECGCYVTMGRAGGTVVLCAKHDGNAADLLAALEEIASRGTHPSYCPAYLGAGECRCHTGIARTAIAKARAPQPAAHAYILSNGGLSGSLS